MAVSPSHPIMATRSDSDARDSITTVALLMRACRDESTRGYDAEVNVHSDREAYDGFLVIVVESNDPAAIVDGQWWFDTDDNVMQVL